MSLKKKITLSPQLFFLSLGIILGEIWLLRKRGPWPDFALFFIGALVGSYLPQLDWFFPKKEIKKSLPFILAPLTLFILTSTNSVFGQSLIIFFNCKLLLDNLWPNKDNENQLNDQTKNRF